MKLRLTSRIVLSFVLLAATLLATVGFLSYRSGRESLQAAALSEVVAKGIEKEATVDNWIEERLADLRQIAREGSVVETMARLITAAPGSEAEKSARELALNKIQPHLSRNGLIELFVIEPASGIVVVSTSAGEVGKSKIGHPYFDNGRHEVYLQAPYQSADLGVPTMTAAIPLRAAAGHLVAVLAARLDLRTVTDIVQRRTGLRQSEDSFAINADQFLITQPRFMSEPMVLRRKLDTESARRCASRTNGVFLAADYRGVPSIAAYRWNARRQFGLVTKVDQAEALAPVQELRRSVILISSLALLATTALAIFLARTITRPLRALHDGVRRLADGKLAERRLESSRDEIGLLAREFSEMAERAVDRTSKLAEASEALAAKQQFLEVVLDSIQAGVMACSAEGKMTVFNREAREFFGITDPSLPSDRWNDYYGICRADGKSPMPTEEFPLFRALQGECVVDAEISIAVKDNPARSFVVRGQPIAPLNGKNAGAVVVMQEITEQKCAAQTLRESNQRFDAVIRATTNVMWDWNPQSNALWWSDQFQTAFGYSPSETGGMEEFVKRIHPDEIARVVEGIQAALRGNEGSWSDEYRFRRSDGTYVSTIDRASILRDGQGKASRMIGAMEDISERKRNETALHNLHQEMVDLSRQAGMSEVATSVLHNVGNVLNSVNVSTELIADGIKGSRLGDLGKATALLEEHAGDLAAFLTVDERGKQLPQFFVRVNRRLIREHEIQLRELDLLCRNVGHIKEIVATQQEYAKVAGQKEEVCVKDLVEDAFRLNAVAFGRHGVLIVREYSDAPPIITEKHKVLQILVNLMRNAKDAVDAGGAEEKQLRLVIRNGGGSIKISVIDNGVGIPSENLMRIFSHGFTTRKDGHGFGLHSGALAAKELGGSLTARSDGPGKGATFTLELPGTLAKHPEAAIAAHPTESQL